MLTKLITGINISITLFITQMIPGLSLESIGLIELNLIADDTLFAQSVHYNPFSATCELCNEACDVASGEQC